jgi:hypothetical protein
VAPAHALRFIDMHRLSVDTPGCRGLMDYRIVEHGLMKERAAFRKVPPNKVVQAATGPIMGQAEFPGSNDWHDRARQEREGGQVDQFPRRLLGVQEPEVELEELAQRPAGGSDASGPPRKAATRAPQRDMVCDRSCLCCSRNRGNPGYGLWLVTEKLVTFEVLPRSTNLSRLTTHRHPISRTLRRASHR